VNVPSNADALTVAQEKGIGGDNGTLLFKMLMEEKPVEWRKTDNGVWMMKEVTTEVTTEEGDKDGVVVPKDITEKIIAFNEKSEAEQKELNDYAVIVQRELAESDDNARKQIIDRLAKVGIEVGKFNEIHKPEETENEIRIPNPKAGGNHKDCKLRRMTLNESKGIFALYCVDHKKIKTYIFDKSKWSMSEAQQWVKDNAKTIDEWLTAYDEMYGDITELLNSEKGRWAIQTIIEPTEKAKENMKDHGIEFIEIEEHVGEVGRKTTIRTEPEPIYKERWNKSLSRVFDVERVEAPNPPPFLYSLYERFLECKIKEIFQNGFSIPSPLLGTYLSGFKAVMGDFKLKDTRNFYAGREVPPYFEIIQLTSEKSDDFLISGMNFYDASGTPIVVNFSPNWCGLDVDIITSNKHKKWNKELMIKVHTWAKDHNLLKGEKFSLSGEFLPETDDGWDGLVIEDKSKEALKKSINFLDKWGAKMSSRGLLFIGPPGTGKTKTGRVLMNRVDTTFIWVSSRDFRYTSEMRAMTLSFSMARDLAPSILFIEDIDHWLRGSTVDLIKTEMDGIKLNKGTITILTSNYPEKLPDALLDRPGRFHHIINFGLPNSKQREEMIRLWAGEIDETLTSKIVAEMDGFSGAHIKELVEFAKILSDDEEIEMGEALVRSLARIKEQRELIENIRADKTMEEIITKNIEDSEEKLGAVLSKRNKTKLKQAMSLTQEVLDDAEPPENEEEKIVDDDEIDIEIDEPDTVDPSKDFEIDLDDEIEIEDEPQPRESKTHQVEMDEEKYQEFLGTIKKKVSKSIEGKVRETLGLMD